MARSLAAPAPPRAPVRRAPARKQGRRANANAPTLPRRWMPAPAAPAGVLRALRAASRGISRRRRLRVALLVLAVVACALAGGWLWLRSSPFVAVRDVQIAGVHGPEAAAVDAALEAAARRMSTLDVNAGALSASVAALRVVQSVRAIPRFPHGLRVEVTEQLPVASLTAAGVRTAVAADGVVLGPTLLSASLPSVSGPVVPAPGQRVRGVRLLGELAVLGAAPALLSAHVERAFTGARGLTLAMRNGLLVYFGDGSRPHAKWLSLARVLADPSSAGASYVDVRLPSHPAAGFAAGAAPADTAPAAQASGESVGSTETTIASLAARLSDGGAGESSVAQEPSSGSASEPSGEEASAPAEGEQATSPEAGGAPSEAAGAGGESQEPVAQQTPATVPAG